MWRLWHKLFGWQYVVVSVVQGDSLVAKVHSGPDGIPYVMAYGDIVFLTYDRESSARPGRYWGYSMATGYAYWRPLTPGLIEKSE